MQKQYLLFLLCSSFFGSVSAMENGIKALSIKRAISLPLGIPSPRHLTIPQLRDDDEHSKHAHSPVRYWGYSPDDPNSLVLLTTAASFGEDYLHPVDDEWPSY
jgi:hypothetical protein